MQTKKKNWFGKQLLGDSRHLRNLRLIKIEVLIAKSCFKTPWKLIYW